MPIPLFKYFTQASAEAVLTHRTLRWSSPPTLNDPFDMQTGLDLHFDEDIVVEKALQKAWESLHNGMVPIRNALGGALALMRIRGPHLSRQKFETMLRPGLIEGCSNARADLPGVNASFLRTVASTKVLCLSASPVVSPLWSHYAESHRGVVLEFGEESGMDSPWKLAVPMNYVDAPPRLYDEEFLSDMLSGRTAMDVRSVLDRYIYTKGREWEPEREHRISMGLGRNKAAPFELLPFGAKELIRLIIGYRMEEADKIKFTALARAVNPEVKISQAIRQGFGLEIVDI